MTLLQVFGGALIARNLSRAEAAAGGYLTQSWSSRTQPSAVPTAPREAIRARLVDELHLVLVPVLVGGGTQALPDGVLLQLELLDERRFASGIVISTTALVGVQALRRDDAEMTRTVEVPDYEVYERVHGGGLTPRVSFRSGREDSSCCPRLFRSATASAGAMVSNARGG